MTLIDNATLTLRHDIDGDGTTEIGEFEIVTNVEVEQQMRNSYLLDNTIDRVLGIYSGAFNNNDAVKRSGITEDVGGGRVTYDISFTESDAGTNQWGEVGGDAQSDATGDSARRKADVLMRYILTGSYDTRNPLELQFGEYNPNGAYENFIPCTVQDVRMTVSSDSEQTIEGRITLQRVVPLDEVKSDRERGV